MEELSALQCEDVFGGQDSMSERAADERCAYMLFIVAPLLHGYDDTFLFLEVVFCSIRGLVLFSVADISCGRLHVYYWRS